MAYVVMVHIVMVDIVMAYIMMVIQRRPGSRAYIVMAYLVMAYLVTAYIVMAYTWLEDQSDRGERADTTLVQELRLDTFIIFLYLPAPSRTVVMVAFP